MGSLSFIAAPAHAAPVSATIGGITYEANDADVAAGATTTSYDSAANPDHPDVTIPDSVEIAGNSYDVVEIGRDTFRSSSLSAADIGHNVRIIGSDAFYGNNLQRVTFGNSVEEIRGRAFSSNDLTSVNLSDTLTSIGVAAFYGNEITRVVIPESVVEIGRIAFGFNPDLAEVQFLGPPPQTFTDANAEQPSGLPDGSLGPGDGLQVLYRCAFDIAGYPDGFTSPEWMGYNAAAANDVNVAFEMNGHGTQVDPEYVTCGQQVPEPDAPAESGWEFTGWYTNEAMDEHFDFDSALTADTTLFAGWVPAEGDDIGNGSGDDAAPGDQAGLTPTADDVLPTTGSPVSPAFLGIALLTVAAGIGLMIAGRRRIV